MDKYDYLKLMIENQDIWVDEKADIYFDAHEKYFDIVDYDDDHAIPDKMEIELLIKTFYNIDLYGYLVDSMIDRLYLFMDDSDENFKFALDKLFENKKGYYMMMRLLSFLDSNKCEHMYDVLNRIKKLDSYDKFILYKWILHDSTKRSEDLMAVVTEDKPKYLKRYVKIKYDENYFYTETKICINKRDYKVIELVQGCKLYIDDDLYIHVLWDKRRKEINEKYKHNGKNINLVGIIRDYYLFERDGYYYLRHGDYLNLNLYDVAIGNNLEDVLEDVNLFSWIR